MDPGRLMMVAAGLALAVMAPSVGRPETPCVPSTPGNVVRCLNLAFQNRDSTAVAALLADTFIWEYRSKDGEPVPDPTDKAITLKGLGRLFTSPKVARVSCTLFFDGKPESRADGDYLLDGVHAIWEVEDRNDGGESTGPPRIHRVDKKNITLEVLRVPGPEPRYVLARWTEDMD